jgi:hypothetical protein
LWKTTFWMLDLPLLTYVCYSISSACYDSRKNTTSTCTMHPNNTSIVNTRVKYLWMVLQTSWVPTIRFWACSLEPVQSEMYAVAERRLASCCHWKETKASHCCLVASKLKDDRTCKCRVIFGTEFTWPTSNTIVLHRYRTHPKSLGKEEAYCSSVPYPSVYLIK